MIFVYLGIDVAVGENQIGPAVIVEVEKHRAPAQILGVQAQAGSESGVGEGAVAIVVVERRRIVGEVGFEDVEAAIAVVVGDGCAHAGLLAAVFVEGGAGGDGYIGESAVAIVAIQNARRAVAGYVNVGPAVIIVVKGRDAQCIMAIGLVDVSFGSDVLKRAIAAVVVKNIFRGRQASRAAHLRRPFPDARSSLSRGGGGC